MHILGKADVTGLDPESVYSGSEAKPHPFSRVKDVNLQPRLPQRDQIAAHHHVSQQPV